MIRLQTWYGRALIREILGTADTWTNVLTLISNPTAVSDESAVMITSTGGALVPLAGNTNVQHDGRNIDPNR